MSRRWRSDGQSVARNINARCAGRAAPAVPLNRDQGTLATIAATRAFANVFGVQASGLSRGDVARIHIIQLIGFRKNKLFVLINWAWIISSTSGRRG